VHVAFNLALYYLTAGQEQQAHDLYRETLAGDPSVWRIQAAILDLETFLDLFADHALAQTALALLQECAKGRSQSLPPAKTAAP
jgi:tetratricopeptide (TPR) repeat protein